VGDYTRMLAAELNASGHQCSLLSLADPQVGQAVTGTTGDIPLLRLPATASWPDRIGAAKKFCDYFAPDWVSWQIVLYGYDPRGLCLGLGARMKQISGGYKNQIMFHELWIGIAQESPLKNKLVGTLQRLIIKDVLRTLRPRFVHTHTPLYRHLLDKLRTRATILPLFGNIPITTSADFGWLSAKWPQAWGQFDYAERDSWWIFVIFGSIHPEWDGVDFLNRAMAASQRAGKKCLLISIGRPGAAGQGTLQEIQKHEGNTGRLLILGAQSEEDISQCLLMADFGISAVPPEYLFKSGTVTAMIEHGLPIIATRSMYHYSDCTPEMLTVGMGNVARDFELDGLRKTPVASRLPAVAAQFVADLPTAA
jgi:glycosyltransferase involved in cell wall biosynthesis